MKEWGCNALRMHTCIKWWIENNSSYRQHIRDIITWAGERGIYVIFEPFSVIGAGQYALPWGEYIPEEQRAIMPNSSAFINYWVSVVNTLKDLPNVLFEFYNEPGCRNVAGYPDINVTEFFNVAQEWINAVRAGAYQPLIIQLGASLNTYVLSFEQKTASYIDGLQWIEQHPLTDSLNNLIYGFHWYRGAILKGENGTTIRCWEYDELKIGMEICYVKHVLEDLNKPLFVGEVGANLWWTGDELERELAFFNNSLAIFNEWGISYTVYTWTIPEHNRYGILTLTEDKWYCEPNEAGHIVIKHNA
jgi:aryl-phospho-beta-D-glucosidase BglC (GH1 family)